MEERKKKNQDEKIKEDIPQKKVSCLEHIFGVDFLFLYINKGLFICYNLKGIEVSV